MVTARDDSTPSKRVPRIFRKSANLENAEKLSTNLENLEKT